MLSSHDVLPAKNAAASEAGGAPELPRWRLFAALAGVLLLCFGLPLFQLVRFALASDLYSHIPLIPAVSAYFVWLERQKLHAPYARALGATLALGAASLLVLFVFLNAAFSGATLPVEDSLALKAGAFVLLLATLCAALLGRHVLRALAFPLGFLVFMIPFPTVVHAGIETFLQHGSAAVAHGFFVVSGMPVFVQGLFFQLPGFNMQVAPECSGIHSSLALLITSIVAGQLFLRSRWRRTALAAFVIPLALVRNGFRVFVIGQLCVRISPDMIHSYIHRQGGPIFFALSLVPFSIALYFLFRSERRARQTKPTPA